MVPFSTTWLVTTMLLFNNEWPVT